MDADAGKVGEELVTSKDAAPLLKLLELEEQQELGTDDDSEDVESVTRSSGWSSSSGGAASSTMEGFQYSPLETPTIIRLVELPINTGKDDAPDAKPELVLRHYELADNRQRYRALSYVWGDPTRRNLISLNSRDFWVTDSLMFFLKRPRTETFYYWIDAISLDQDDEEEKASQIPRMKEIYENAAYVFADLGPASEDEELAVDHILEIARVVLPFVKEGLEKRC
jgi:hypothetical protein